jgi:hypothetical protein
VALRAVWGSTVRWRSSPNSEVRFAGSELFCRRNRLIGGQTTDREATSDYWRSDYGRGNNRSIHKNIHDLVHVIARKSGKILARSRAQSYDNRGLIVGIQDLPSIKDLKR